MKIYRFNLAICLFMLLGCGGGGGLGSSGKNEVVDVNFRAKDINVGEQVRVDIYFDVRSDGEGNPEDNVEMVVLVERGLEFLDGSSRIYDEDFSRTRERTPDRIENCSTGETYLFYRLDRDELQPTLVDQNGGSQGIRVQLVGARSGTAGVKASVGTSETFQCGDTGYTGEKSEEINVE
jgi:hypothetical protein